MSKKKAKKEQSQPDGFYKGYDMRWLEKEPAHPDYHLVAEYKSKFNIKDDTTMSEEEKTQEEETAEESAE